MIDRRQRIGAQPRRRREHQQRRRQRHIDATRHALAGEQQRQLPDGERGRLPRIGLHHVDHLREHQRHP